MEYIIVWALVFVSWTPTNGNTEAVIKETMASYHTEADCEAQKSNEFDRLPQLHYECVEKLAMRRK